MAVYVSFFNFFSYITIWSVLLREARDLTSLEESNSSLTTSLPPSRGILLRRVVRDPV